MNLSTNKCVVLIFILPALIVLCGEMFIKQNIQTIGDNIQTEERKIHKKRIKKSIFYVIKLQKTTNL